MDDYGCSFCNVFYPSNQELFEHELSLMHHTKVQKVTNRLTHPCGVCDIVCHSLAEYGYHIKKDGHQQAVIHSRRAVRDAEKTPHNPQMGTADHYWQDDLQGGSSWVSKGRGPRNHGNYDPGNHGNYDYGDPGDWDNRPHGQPGFGRGSWRKQNQIPARMGSRQWGAGREGEFTQNNWGAANYAEFQSKHHPRPNKIRPQGQVPIRPLIHGNPGQFAGSPQQPMPQSAPRHPPEHIPTPRAKDPGREPGVPRQKWTINRSGSNVSMSRDERNTPRLGPRDQRSSSLDAPSSDEQGGPKKDSLQAKLSLKANKIIDDVLKGGTGKNIALEESQPPDKGAELLQKAESLCKELRERRHQAVVSKESADHRRKKQERDGLSKQIEAMSERSMSRVKGLLDGASVVSTPRGHSSGSPSSSSFLSRSSSLASHSYSHPKTPPHTVTVQHRVDSSVRLPARKSKGLDKDCLMKLVNSPRSRKERLQVTKMLQRYSKTQKHTARPKLHLQSSSEEKGSDTEPENVEFIDLPQDVQDQIAQLLDEELADELGFDVADLFGDKEDPGSDDPGSPVVLPTTPQVDLQDDFTKDLLEKPRKSSTPDDGRYKSVLGDTATTWTKIHGLDFAESESQMDAQDTEVAKSPTVDDGRHKSLLDNTAATWIKIPFPDFAESESQMDAQDVGVALTDTIIGVCESVKSFSTNRTCPNSSLDASSQLVEMQDQPSDLPPSEPGHSEPILTAVQIKQEQFKDNSSSARAPALPTKTEPTATSDLNTVILAVPSDASVTQKQPLTMAKVSSARDVAGDVPGDVAGDVPGVAGDVAGDADAADEESSLNSSMSLGGKRRHITSPDVTQPLGETASTPEKVKQMAKRAKMDTTEALPTAGSVSGRETSVMDQILQLSLQEEVIRQKIDKTNAAVEQLMAQRAELIKAEQILRTQRLELLKGAVGMSSADVTVGSTIGTTGGTPFNQSLSSSFMNMMEDVDIDPSVAIETTDAQQPSLATTASPRKKSASFSASDAPSDQTAAGVRERTASAGEDPAVTMHYVGTLEGESDLLKQMAVNFAKLKQESYMFVDESSIGAQPQVATDTEQCSPEHPLSGVSDNASTVAPPVDSVDPGQADPETRNSTYWTVHSDFSLKKSTEPVQLDTNGHITKQPADFSGPVPEITSAKSKKKPSQFYPHPDANVQQIRKSRKFRDQNSSLSTSNLLDSSSESTAIEDTVGKKKRGRRSPSPVAKVVQDYLHAPSSSDVEIEGLEAATQKPFVPMSQGTQKPFIIPHHSSQSFTVKSDNDTPSFGALAEDTPSFGDLAEDTPSFGDLAEEIDTSGTFGELETSSEDTFKWTREKKNKRPPETKKHMEGHEGAVLSMVPWGAKILITGGTDGTVRIFNAKTGQNRDVWQTHDAGVTGLWMFLSSKRLNLFSGGLDSQLVVRNFKKGPYGKLVNRQKFAHPLTCFGTSWTKKQSSNTLFIGMANGAVLCYNPELMKAKDAFKCSELPICDIGVAQEGGRPVLCVASQDCLITIRDAKSGILYRTFEGHTKAPIVLKVRHNLVFSGGADRTLQVHDLNNGDLKKVVQLPSGVTHMSSAGGNHMAVSMLDGRINILELPFPYDNRKEEFPKMTLACMYYGAKDIPVTRMYISKTHIYAGSTEGTIAGLPCKTDIAICMFGSCTHKFRLCDDLLTHVMKDHMGPHIGHEKARKIKCLWKGCKEFVFPGQDIKWTEIHYQRHIG